MGKQSIPREFKRKFDIVTCSDNLGTNLFPASCFKDMLGALKSGGYVVFTVPLKHLQPNASFNMGYAEAIERLIQKGACKPLHYRVFDKCHYLGHFGENNSSKERSALLVLRKE